MRLPHVYPVARLAAVAALLGTVFVTGCGQPPANQEAATTSGAKARVDPATAGRLEGRVTLNGETPAPEVLRIVADQTCIAALGSSVPSDALMVGADHGVKNAFVYIKDALSDYQFDVPATAVTLDQVGCRYVPRVVGVQVGQPIEFINSDATLHNVHSLPMVNQEYNQGMPRQNSRMSYVFTAPEQMVRFKCDLHLWMNAYVGVMPHPFYAVTDDAGRFTIAGLPPGKYQLTVWHEKLAGTTVPVEITAGAATPADFALDLKK
jgi:plastocyanin